MRTIENKAGASVVSAYTYGVNSIGQRDSVTTSGSAFAGGLDVAGASGSSSMQAAGGVGGLLANRIGSINYHPFYDGNGNITQYMTETGGTSAHYEYDPFGTLTRRTGLITFTYRFSTKPRDTVTGLYYYGYRWYVPATGRWLSEDPIGEVGGLNLYGFVGNDGVNMSDKLGLESNTGKRDCNWMFLLGHGSAQDLTRVSTNNDTINKLPEIRKIAKWSQGIDVPQLGCGDRIGFQGCHRQNMNNTLESIFGKDKILSDAERDDNRMMFDKANGNKEVADREKGQGFHADTRNRIDKIIQSAKKECDNDKSCCKKIFICPRTQDPTIKSRVFNNINHYRIQDGYIHSDVVKKNLAEYIINNECITVNCDQ